MEIPIKVQVECKDNMIIYTRYVEVSVSASTRLGIP